VTSTLDMRVMVSYGSAARVLVTNSGPFGLYLMPGAVLRGQALYTGDPLTVEATDDTSATHHGAREVLFDLPALTSVEEARSIAAFELTRRNTARAVVTSMTLRSGANRPQALARTLFDRVTVSETATGHSADYVIVGERHTVRDGGASHAVTWTLEPANPGEFFVINTSHLGVDTRLAY
ncbi:MAG: hypothetical protein AAF125_14040, partial [Chloroflexota bacterium]